MRILSAAQLDIIKTVIDFAITDIVTLNFRKHCAKGNEEETLSRNWFGQNSVPCNVLLLSELTLQ